MPQGSPELITSFIQFPVTLLSNLPEALIFRGEVGGGQGCWREGAAHKGEKGKHGGLASESLFLQPSETPAHFRRVFSREGFFPTASALTSVPVGGGHPPANSKCPGLAQPDALSPSGPQQEGELCPSATRP